MNTDNNQELAPLPIIEDRPFLYFEYIPGKPENPTSFNKGMKFEVVGYSADGDKLKLPRLVRQFYRTEEAAAVATGLLFLFAVGKNKIEIDTMKGMQE